MRFLIDGGSNSQGSYDVGERVITPILLSKKGAYIELSHKHAPPF